MAIFWRAHPGFPINPAWRSPIVFNAIGEPDHLDRFPLRAVGAILAADRNGRVTRVSVVKTVSSSDVFPELAPPDREESARPDRLARRLRRGVILAVVALAVGGALFLVFAVA
jgi:hypothetical protein